MAPKYKRYVNNIEYHIYEKSISIPKCGINIFINRTPEENDINNISKLIELGEKIKQDEIKDSLGIK